MARPLKERRICGKPKNCLFNPEIDNLNFVQITLDQYEVIRLIDYEKLTQEECAKQMNVARTTVQAIYEEARFKISDALINGKKIIIKGGNVRVCGNGYGCKRCFSNDTDNIEKIDFSKNVKIAVLCFYDKISENFRITNNIKIYDQNNYKIISKNECLIKDRIDLFDRLVKEKVNLVIANRIGKRAKMFLKENNMFYIESKETSSDLAIEELLKKIK